MALLVARAAAGELVAGAQPEALALRREYNAVAASIDTLVRLGAGPGLPALLARGAGRPDIVPAGFTLVVLLWADDEAELSLNGLRVARTRLTPVEVAIPAAYVAESNVLVARCWDTDRVESGFMAGVYLRDQAGLRPVLVTDAAHWRLDGAPAAEIYYAHSQPDIPSAKVLWGPQLFGRVQLAAEFSAASLAAAAGVTPLARPRVRLEQRPMEDHEVVERLVRLQRRREELAAALARLRTGTGAARFAGAPGAPGGLAALSLGRAGRLADSTSAITAERVARWASSLPPAQRALLLDESRPLKGETAATAERGRLPGASSGTVDRRSDYRPPPERPLPVAGGSGGRRGAGGAGGTASGVWVGARRSRGWVPAVLAVYLVAVTRHWWRLYRGEVWYR